MSLWFYVFMCNVCCIKLMCLSALFLSGFNYNFLRMLRFFGSKAAGSPGPNLTLFARSFVNTPVSEILINI